MSIIKDRDGMDLTFQVPMQYCSFRTSDFTSITSHIHNWVLHLLWLCHFKKDRNGMALTEAEDIKKRWQENTEELYKNGLHDPDNNNGMITHLEPDILECKVKWTLGNITTKLVEVMEFQLSYFKS